MIHADQESAMPAAYAATPFAQRLGLTFRSMRYRLKKLGLD